MNIPYIYITYSEFYASGKNFPYIFPVTSNSSQFQGRDGIVPPPPDETLGQTLVPLATRFVGPQQNWGFVGFFLKCSSLHFFRAGHVFYCFLYKKNLYVIFDSG